MFDNNARLIEIGKLDFLCGDWTGEGLSMGQTVTGTLSGNYRFQKSFIELEEKLRNPSGEIIYEDCTWISFKEKPNQLKATQFMVPGVMETKIVVLTPNGCRWWMGPHAPWVEFKRGTDDNQLRIEDNHVTLH